MIQQKKIIRFFQAFRGIEGGRKGKCASNECRTLDGNKGSACCKLGFLCPLLKKCLNCRAYKARLPNCRVFPRSREDLKLVKNCGFYWEEKENEEA